MNNDGKLTITDEELDEVESRQARGHLILSAEELDNVPQPRAYAPLHDYEQQPFSQKGYLSKLDKLDRYLPTRVWQMALAGVVGALVASVINELFMGDNRRMTDSVLMDMAIWGGIVSFIISLSFGVVGGWLNRSYERMWKDGLRQGLYGALGGAVGSFFGQLVYGELGGGYVSSLATQIFARTLGWALLGLGIGFANGSVVGTQRHITNGLLGGLAGGALGGVLFDIIGQVSDSGVVSRLVGFIALGGLIGTMIALVEHLRKEVWLSAQAGPLQGKQFILFKPDNTFGSTGKADIVLFGDQRVPPIAFSISQGTHQRYILRVLSPELPVYVNGHAQVEQVLKNGDRIQIGVHELCFHEVLKRVSDTVSQGYN